MKKVSRGFTLTEVLITVLILGVLAGLALPTFFSAVERSRSNEALTNLNIIHMGEKIYRLSNPAFVAGANVTALNTALTVDMASSFYDCAAVIGGVAPNDTYTATCTRNFTSGGAGSKWFRYSYTNAAAAPVLTQGGNY